jgi:VWFA-related protein
MSRGSVFCSLPIPVNSVSVAALALAAVQALCGQETAPFDSDIVIRSNTNLVQVRVVAEDSKGRPVTDLQRSDFQIQDDRKPQPLALFSADRGTVPAPSAAAAQPTGQSTDSTPAAAGYSVILLDWLNTPYTYRLQAQEQFLTLLKRYQPRQKVAVYLLDHDPRLLLDFTSDMDIVRQVVEEAGLEFGIVEDSAPGRFDARYTGRAPAGNTEEQLLFWQNKVLDTLHTLEVVADHLAHVPGRKTLVWLTPGIPLTVGGNVAAGAKQGELNFLPRVETARAKLNRADIAVYTVNPCGLSMVCRSYGPMYEFTSRTGGAEFAGRNDIDEGMRLALEDMRISYTLGFNVPEGAAPGLHEIHVRVNRPGVKLRYRESYDLFANSR